MTHTALSFSKISKVNKSDADIDKFNPYHDSKGRFTTSGGGASFSGTLLHGSPNKGIKEFDISRAGSNTGSGEKLLFFTNDKDLADDFSYERLPGSTKFVNVRGEKGEVYRTKVQMKKPLDFRNLSDDDIKAIKELDADGILSSDDIKMLAGMKNHGSLKAALDLRPEALKRLGYDGIIANTVNGKTEFAVIDSKQTKILNKSFSELEKFNPHHDRLGRFASSGGGIGANAKASERGHVETKSYDESIKTVKQELGCDDKQAKKYAKSVYSFTSENYEAIRAYQSGKKNDYTKKFSRDAKAVEDYIEKAPHWNGGTLYRGINLESGDVKTLFKPGTEMDMKGTSSWSSEKKIADSYTFGSGTKVIFQCDKISKATSVAHLSDTPSEKEVLVSKDTKYISKKVSKKGNVYYVYLDEVTSMAKSFSDIMKYNPNHDNLGRFSSGNGGAAVSGGISPEFRATLYQAESDSIWESNEVSTVYDSKGNQLFQKTGDEHHVEFSDDEITKLQGATLTHNHPNNSFFSEEDLSVATEYGLKEIRACTEQAIYSFKPAEMTNSLIFNNRYKKFNESITQELKDEFLKKIDNHEMTSDDAQKEYVKELANRRSQFFKEQQKFFKYEYEEIKWDSFEDLW